jgi:capsular exopolysaccharide synthesis family protein
VHPVAPEPTLEREWTKVLARRWKLVAVAVAAALLVAVALTVTAPRRWIGTTTVQIEPGSSLIGGSVRSDDLAYLDRLINTYAALAGGAQTRERVARELKLSKRPAISVTEVANTNLMKIKATADGPGVAAQAANQAASVLIDEVKSYSSRVAQTMYAGLDGRAAALEAQLGQAEARLKSLEAAGVRTSPEALRLGQQITDQRNSLAALRNDYEASQSAQRSRANALSVITPATPSPKSANRNLALVLPAGLLLGLAAGALLAGVAENLSRRSRTKEELEASLDAPVLASVPTVPHVSRAGLFDGRSGAEEAFRRLRTALLLQPGGGPRSLLLTSSTPGEGKSTVVANLARALAQAGRRTVAVDADLWAPALHRYFGTSNESGLCDLLATPRGEPGPPVLEFCLPTSIPGLSLLPAGGAVEDPATLLSSSRAQRLFTKLAGEFDFMLVDSPAVLAVTDPLVLTKSVNAVLFVVGADTEPEDVRAAYAELARIDAVPMGIVLNGGADHGPHGYGDPARRSVYAIQSDYADVS